MRLHALQNRVEVVRSDFDELAVFEARKRIYRLTGEIPQNSHHEWQLLHFDGVAHFHVVGDLYAWRPNPVEFVLCTCFGHFATPRCATGLDYTPEFNKMHYLL